MIYTTILNIAGLDIEIETEMPLHINAGFVPFLVDKKTGDSRYEAVYRRTDRLELPPEGGCIHTRDFDVYEESPGSYARFYRDGRTGRYYAVSRFVPESRTVQIRYLAGAEENVSETGNSFFHIEWENLLLREKKMMLHAACTHHPKLGGILFSGPSGVGKSTQADLWRRYQDARMINGDRTIMGRTEQGWIAYSGNFQKLPCAGSSASRRTAFLRSHLLCTRQF